MRGVRYLTHRLMAARSARRLELQEISMTPESRLEVNEVSPLALNDEAPPARLVAGALAHLARHMETGCPRASSLAILLLDKVANDVEADAHLRRHARELVEVLERDDVDVH